jgi:hypothetical protein
MESTANTAVSAVDLVRRDSAISGLGLLLAPEQLRDGLNRLLGSEVIEHISLNYLRYKKGINCLGRYDIQAGGRTISAFAKAHGSDSSGKLSKAVERPSVDSVIGPGRVLLREAGIVFSVFPNDAKLPSLTRLQSDNQRRRLFGRIFGRQSPWLDSEIVEVLNYKPERRHVVRLQRDDGQSALLKFYTLNGFSRALAIHRGMGDLVPEVLGRAGKHGVIAYRWQTGDSLRELGNRVDLLPGCLAATAGSLAAAHASDPSGLCFPDFNQQEKSIYDLAYQVGFLLPHLHKRAVHMACRLVDWLCRQPSGTAVVHGDFYDKQVIVNGDEAKLIDFDEVSLGHPLLDLGNYGAHLEWDVTRGSMTKPELELQQRTLLSAYERVAGPVHAMQLHKYTALGLFRLLHHPFRDWEDDWPVKTGRLLSRVESLFEGDSRT